MRRRRSLDLPAERLRHEALEPLSGGVALTGLGEAGRSDRQRMALLLEAVALLAHLSHAHWHLTAGWEAAGVDRDGRLRVRGARPGACRQLPQEHLRELVGRLFGGAARGHRGLAGRGPVRRAVRALERRWWQTLAAVDVDSAVAAVLDEAPFLWQPPFAAARRSLAAEHVRQGGGGLWVVGSGAARRRFLASANDLDSLRAALAAPDAGRRWLAAATASGGGPTELAATGRWRAAVAAWQLSPPADDAGFLRLAAAWLALGRAERALEALDSLEVSGTEAEVLRATCLSWLGRLRAARRAIQRAEELAPTGDLALSLAEVAVRNEANRGDPGAGRRRARALLDTVRRGPAARRARARLIAAQAAWDAGDTAEMEEHLTAAERLTAPGEVDWRWLQVRALLHLERGEADEAIVRLVSALGRHRRSLRRFEAAGLWNDLGVARGRAGDLAGAERALLHALRLHQACDGSRATTLGLANLAEVRLRRGRLLGVEEILAATSAANRAAGNLRGTVSDRLLAARFALVHGDCKGALALLGEAIGLAERRGFAGQLGEARVLSARALGWLGRGADAAAELAATTAADLEHLEPEEHPAVLALAGRRDEALAAAVRIGELGEPWLAVLTPAAAPPSWKASERLEPYRTARLVADLERFAAGSVPSPLRRRAIATFRRLGAGREADRLEAREHGSWQALAAYLGGRRDGPALAELFADAGYADARLWWECEDDARVLVPGSGGGEEVSAVVAEGRLVLRAPQMDPPLASLFRLARAEWEGRPAAMVHDRQRAPDRSSAISVGEGGTPARRAPGGIVGSSPELVSALRRVERLAPGELPLLVLGESGTGKELVARLIHRRSRRRDRPLVAVNCAALSESLVLSDLFGHTRGAFTGAERDRAGVFETADGGTVFLDEIGDLPASAQGMLLRVLQEGEVRRVGESVPRRVDVRVVAATHRDLAGMVAAGSFREDLFYRLKGAAIELPPLRARGADVIALAEHLLAGLADRLGPGASPPRLSSTAADRLLTHSWPGNVRELENVLGVAAALAAADGGTILPEHLELPSSSGGEENASCYHARVDALRRRLVAEALDAAGGVQAEAARRLGLSRQAMSYLVRRLGVC